MCYYFTNSRAAACLFYRLYDMKLLKLVLKLKNNTEDLGGEKWM